MFKETSGVNNDYMEYWRMVHTEFFMDEAKEFGLIFNENINVLCEEFELVFKCE